jgi:serine/threonine protein kinase/Leucine-rich repeat (LRR) protein
MLFLCTPMAAQVLVVLYMSSNDCLVTVPNGVRTAPPPPPPAPISLWLSFVCLVTVPSSFRASFSYQHHLVRLLSVVSSKEEGLDLAPNPVGHGLWHPDAGVGVINPRSRPLDPLDPLGRMHLLTLSTYDDVTVLKVFTGLTHLRDLDLTQVPVFKSNITEHTDLFATMNTLQNLWLGQTNMTHSDLQLLVGLTTIRFLDLGSNFITSLPDNLFTNYTQLEVLLIDNNAITRLQADVFNTLSKLTDLLGIANAYQTIELGAFNGLTRLTLLNMGSHTCSKDEVDAGTCRTSYGNRGPLTMFESGLFDPLISLQRLFLPTMDFAVPSNGGNGGNGGDNGRCEEGGAELPKDLFAKLTALTELSFSDNKLNGLPVGIFDAQTRTSVLTLNGNGLTQLDPLLFRNMNRSLITKLVFDAQFDETCGGGISNLDSKLFAGMCNLQGLFLSSNSITSLPKGIFDDLASLSNIDFHSNALTILEKGLFLGTPRIENILMQNNAITTIEVGAFTGLTMLFILYLGHNQLLDLPSDVFAGNPIQGLDLSYNQLSKMDAAVWGSLTSAVVLSLAANNISRIDATLQTIWDPRKIRSLAMNGNPSNCWFVDDNPSDVVVCDCAPGHVRADTVREIGLCLPTSEFIRPPTVASLRGPFRIAGPTKYLVKQDNILIPASFVWNSFLINSPSVNVTLVWDEGSNSTGTFAGWYTKKPTDPWSKYCPQCGGKANLMDPNEEGSDGTYDLSYLYYYATYGVRDFVVSIVYSAFFRRDTFDIAFDHKQTIVTAAGQRKPRRLRVWETEFGNVFDGPASSHSSLSPIEMLSAPANVTGNSNVATSITFGFADNNCVPSTGLIVRHALDQQGKVLGWEVVVGGSDVQAVSMKSCTAVLQATDSVTGEVMNVTGINASVADCFDGTGGMDVASRSCNGHGQCLHDPTPYDGHFAGCACDPGYAGDVCSEKLLVCKPDANGRKTANVGGQCKPFILHTNSSGARNIRPGFVYTNPATYVRKYVVGSTYRIAALKLDQAATKVSDGTIQEIKYTLAGIAPPGFFVSSTNGEILAQFDKPGEYFVSLLAVDKSGLNSIVENMTFSTIAKPGFKLAVVPNSRTVTGPEFTDPDLKTTQFVVGESYRIAPRKIDTEQTKTSLGTISDIRYTLIDAPSSWFVSAKTGQIFGIFAHTTNYNFSLQAEDAGNQKQIVEHMTFNVVSPDKFVTSSAWLPDSMMTKDILDKYELGQTVSIPGPSLPRADLFVHASNNDYRPTSITYSLQCTPGTSPSVPTNNNKTKTNDPTCPEFFVDTASGGMLVNMSQPGGFKATLIAKDRGGRIAVVKSWVFSALPLAVANDRNGPNGKGCGAGKKVPGTDVFTSHFTCNCVKTGLIGPNCGTKARDTRSGLLAGVGAAATLLCVAIAAVLRYFRQRAILNAPHSFEKMIASLSAVDVLSLETSVRKRIDDSDVGNIDDADDDALIMFNGSGVDNSKASTSSAATVSYGNDEEVYDDDDDRADNVGNSDASNGIALSKIMHDGSGPHIPTPFAPLFTLKDRPGGLVIPVELPYEQLEIQCSIGQGIAGDVSSGLLRNGRFARNGSRPCAIKMPKLGSGPEAREALLEEAMCLAQFVHRNVIQLFGVVTRNQQCMVVLELCERGSLFDLLRKEELLPANTGTIECGRVLEIAKDVATGMTYMSNLGFVHRDLAARNILMDRHDTCKIADFGLSRLLGESKHYYYVRREGCTFPLRWSAPEVLTTGKFTTCSDVWSFGVLLYEVLTRAEQPFVSCSMERVKEVLQGGHATALMRQHLSLPFPAAEPVYMQLVLPCWSTPAENRPGFAVVLATCAHLEGLFKHAAQSVAEYGSAADSRPAVGGQIGLASAGLRMPPSVGNARNHAVPMAQDSTGYAQQRGPTVAHQPQLNSWHSSAVHGGSSGDTYSSTNSPSSQEWSSNSGGDLQMFGSSSNDDRTYSNNSNDIRNLCDSSSSGETTCSNNSNAKRNLVGGSSGGGAISTFGESNL